MGTEDRFGQLLGPYVLGELTAEEERELEHHLEGCPACRGALEDVRRAHGILRATAAAAPPPELKERVLARARGEAPDRSGIGGAWKVRGAAAALLVVAVLGAGILWTISGGPSEGLRLDATAAAPGAGGELRGEEDGGNLRVELEVWDMPKLQKGEYYEMWYARDGGGRISCGTFRAGPEGRTTLDLSAPASATSYPLIEVTREPDDGDPGATGEKVLVGDLRDL